MILNPEKVLGKGLGIAAHPLDIEKFQMLIIVANIGSSSWNLLNLTKVVWLGRFDYFKKLPFFMHHIRKKKKKNIAKLFKDMVQIWIETWK